MGLLRILLAISVLTAHLRGKSVLSFRLVHGELAVEAFFMISGFYMALVLNQKYKPGQYWIFLKQRWLRLMPVYWVILGLNVLTMVFFVSQAGGTSYLGWMRYLHVPNAMTMAWFVFTNIFIAGFDTLDFSAVNPLTGSLYFIIDPPADAIKGVYYTIIGPAWSLSLEMLFYVMAPFLVRLSWRVQAGIVTCAVLLRWTCVGLLHWQSHYFDNRFFPFELGFFLAGSLAYQVYLRYNQAILRSAARWQYARWFFYVIVIAYSRLPGPDFAHYHIFIVLLFIMIPVLFTITKDLKWDRHIGELSYSFYLAHPMILVLTAALVQKLPTNRWGIAYLLITLCFCHLLYRFFGSKVGQWRESLLRPPTDKKMVLEAQAAARS